MSDEGCELGVAWWWWLSGQGEGAPVAMEATGRLSSS